MKKKFLILLICVLLLTVTFRYAPVSASSYSIIRVRISVGDKSSININVDGEYIIKEEPSISIPRGSYTVSASGKNVRLRGPNIDKVIGATLTFVRCEYKGSGNNHLTIKGTEHGNINYLGDFVFTVSSGTLNVVNHVPLEQYLYGVVAYEMSDSFPLEALKVQAVCARSYAVKAMSSSGTYDIGDQANHQVYKGYNPSYKNVIKAVDATAGEVLSYKNKVISTYYSASNGGQTELPGNMWGGGAEKNKEYPYLVQKDDPYDLENPSSKYQKIFVPKQVEGTDYDPVNIPGDHVVRVVHVNEFANVRKGPGTSYSIIGPAPINSVYEWLGTTGNWNKIIYKGEEAYISGTYSQKVSNGRYLYANSILADIQNEAQAGLESQGIKISSPTDIKIITVNKLENGQERYPGTGSRNYVTAKATANVKYIEEGSSELSGETKEVNVVLELMKKSNGKYTLSHDYLDSDLRMRGVEQAESEGGYYITNRRYGHGVGMSQRGAQTMAGKYNMSYQEILDFYFEGTKIMKVDSSIPSLPDPADIPTLASSKYNIGSNRITGLTTNLSVEKFLSNLTVSNGTVSLSSAGKSKTSGIVATGDILQLRNNTGSIYKEYPLVIYGDVNGDGDITVIDLLRVQKHLLGVTSLNGEYLYAADVSKDSKTTVIDLLRIQKHLLGIQTISQ